MKNILVRIGSIILIFMIFCSHSQALKLENEDPGIELDKIITLGSSFLATALFLISFTAYRRDGRRRLFFVTLAFFLFAIKGFLSASDIIFPERDWVDPVASFLDFAILLCFFFGLLRK